MTREAEDIHLIERIARANSAALGELYDRYGRLIYSLALRLVGDSGLAEEITQDVFLQVWNKAGSYRADLGKVTTWLTSVARHRAIDMLRRQGIRPEGSWTGLDELAFLTSPEEQVEPQALRRREQERVRAALAQLPAEQRAAVGLAYFYGLSQQEIAATLHEPLGTIKTRIRLGMQKLRLLLVEDTIQSGVDTS